MGDGKEESPRSPFPLDEINSIAFPAIEGIWSWDLIFQHQFVVRLGLDFFPHLHRCFLDLAEHWQLALGNNLYLGKHAPIYIGCLQRVGA